MTRIAAELAMLLHSIGRWVLLLHIELYYMCALFPISRLSWLLLHHVQVQN